MTKFCSILLLLFCISFSVLAQSDIDLPTKKLEYQFSYFGEFIAHPGVKLGVNYPIWQKAKSKDRQKKNYLLTKTKIKQWKIGTNAAFYHQVNNHNGYLWNVELTYQTIKTKSKKPNKLKYFDASFGLGYYHYELIGKTFQSTENDFEEINGNGNALMPTLAVAWGRNIRFMKETDVRYYVKPTLLFEMPAGTSFHTRFALEIGLASTF